MRYPHFQRRGDLLAEPYVRAKRQARARARRDYRPLARARRFSRRVARNRAVPKQTACVVQAPTFRDAITGWFGYACAGGTLLVPSPRCVGPDCKGGGRRGTPTLGYGGELDAGSRGSFMQAGRLIGVTAFDGVEIGKGLAEIETLRQNGDIDSYYASAAKRAFTERIGEMPERAAPFEEPSPLGMVLAPGALKRQYRGKTGEDVGPSVREGCGCKVREPDARDPVSGWFIYYVNGGVLLTPTWKCIAGGGRPPTWWERTFRNVVALVKPPPPEPSPQIKMLQPPPPPELPPVPTAPPAPPPSYLCLDPRIWPAAWRPQSTPCVPPAIPWPG